MKEKEIEELNSKRDFEEKQSYQNKFNYNSNEIDEFSGLVRKNTIYYEIDGYRTGYSELSIQLRRYGNSKYASIRSFQDLGCTSPYSTSRSYVKFKLENNDIVTFYHRGDIDCGNFNLLGILTQNDILRLKKSPIKSVRLSGTEYYHDVKELFFKDFFIKKLDCIK